MVVTLGQQYNIGEKPTVMLYTYINRHVGTPDKKQNKKHFEYTIKQVYSYIQQQWCTDPYTIKAYSLEHKQCYNIVIGKEKNIYILQQVHSDTLLRLCVKLLFHRLKIQKTTSSWHYYNIKLITIQGHLNKHDKLGYNSICYIGSKIGWMPMKESLQVRDKEVS